MKGGGPNGIKSQKEFGFKSRNGDQMGKSASVWKGIQRVLTKVTKKKGVADTGKGEVKIAKYVHHKRRKMRKREKRAKRGALGVPKKNN